MLQFETFATRDIAPHRKLEFWNDVACDTITPLTSDAISPLSFSGEISRTRIGDIRIAQLASDPTYVHHTRSHVARARHPTFFLMLQAEGESIAIQDGRTARLGPGDFTLCDSTRPYEMIIERANRVLVLGIPEARLLRHVASPQSLVCVPMRGSSGLPALYSGFMPHVWDSCHRELDEVTADYLMQATLNLVASAYYPMAQGRRAHSSLATAHCLRITNYIESNLVNPELTPTRVAAACRMTPRYLHHLFSQQGETVSRYILRRRLEECSRALCSLTQRNRTVTAIAFDYGFNSPTHFGRVFRDRFGMTPREYRRLHLGKAPHGYPPMLLPGIVALATGCAPLAAD